MKRRRKPFIIDDVWQWLAFAMVTSITLFAFLGSMVKAVFVRSR